MTILDNVLRCLYDSMIACSLQRLEHLKMEARVSG